MTARAPIAVLALALASCIDTGQERVSIPLEVVGVDASPFVADVDWTIALDAADTAFGPLHLCAGGQAGSLCDTARLEWTGSVVVDALDPTPQPAGELVGVSGSVRSWMYDHGITSLLTQVEPLVLDAAVALGGNSIRLAGVARRDGVSLRFVLAMPLRQDELTEQGAPIVRKSANDAFDHDVVGDERALRVRFDPRPWLTTIDFDGLVAAADCAAEGPQFVCAIDAVLGPESQAGRALRTAIVAGRRPEFEWVLAP